ncbi:glycosyltransferase family 9 protein [Nonomuraea phyllanthi]|uniref:Glycosyltransferase family 9 protein n=1 Tax=Nonomuraea phyllanthi TaxID=2219224 RepID=A0A5C4WSW1_9ACTN|nr:glycosyltransferase family 9 protein [Nonomuraea phyllanthi]KAB8196674.1 glycosyltransferase family 9 protein [Nonomuraea phyllanthi]QFY13587.1 glycosyltransferase family 9 protein [Nonomuraea phyllanthi]
MRGTSGLVEGVERIAVLRANALGDFLLALPALDALRRAYPAARLTLLATAWHADFLRGRPGPVDDVVVLPPIPGVSAEEGGHPAPEGLCEELRARRFDLAVQIHGGGRHSNPFISGLGARVTAGMRAPGARPLDRWVPYTAYHHETLRFLQVAALVGAPGGDGLEPRVAVTADDRAELARVLGEPPPGLVAVHPGARDPRRRWPVERFAEVADRLGRPVAVTGTPKEEGLVAGVVEAMRRPAIPVVGTLGIGGLAALYERCDLVIANDTGPRHLAAAVGTPTVAVYWCGNLITYGPLTRTRHRPVVSWTTACPTCGADGMDPGAARCPHDPSWVRDVPVDGVMEQVHDLLDA